MKNISFSNEMKETKKTKDVKKEIQETEAAVLEFVGYDSIKENINKLLTEVEESYNSKPVKELYDLLIDIKVAKKAASLLS